MARIFYYSGWCTEISLEFYGQRAIFGAFVRNQNAFYGQKAVFDHFVRNRHFSGRPFTDKLPIFIDLSVNGSDFEFVLLSRSRGPNLDQPVDKNHTFTTFFVYFWYRAPRFRRTAEITPKQETLRRCLMPVSLHFNAF